MNYLLSEKTYPFEMLQAAYRTFIERGVFELLEETDDYCLYYDRFAGREIQLNKPDYLIREDMIIDTTGEIDKKEVLLFLQNLPQVVLANVFQIYFVKNFAEFVEVSEMEWYEDVIEEYEEGVGRFLYAENVLLVLVDAHKNGCTEMCGDIFDFNRELLVTLAHELYHVFEKNPAVNMDVDEELAESFGRNMARQYYRWILADDTFQ